MTSTAEREPTEEELAEYLDDPYCTMLTNIGAQLIVLTNSIDFDMPADMQAAAVAEVAEGAEAPDVNTEEGMQLGQSGTPPEADESSVSSETSDEAHYLRALQSALVAVETATHLRTRICFRQFPLEEHQNPKAKRKASRAKAQ